MLLAVRSFKTIQFYLFFGSHYKRKPNLPSACFLRAPEWTVLVAPAVGGVPAVGGIPDGPSLHRALGRITSGTEDLSFIRQSFIILSPACRPNISLGFWTRSVCVCVCTVMITTFLAFWDRASLWITLSVAPEEMGAPQTLSSGRQPGYTVEPHLGQNRVPRRLIQDGLKIIQLLNASHSTVFAMRYKYTHQQKTNKSVCLFACRFACTRLQPIQSNDMHGHLEAGGASIKLSWTRTCVRRQPLLLVGAGPLFPLCVWWALGCPLNFNFNKLHIFSRLILGWGSAAMLVCDNASRLIYKCIPIFVVVVVVLVVLCRHPASSTVAACSVYFKQFNCVQFPEMNV